jgi:hypothetical protein
MNTLTLTELNKVADQTAHHAAVIVAQRDPKDNKMDERSALLHRLWIRICGKINVNAGGYPNLKDDVTHERVFAKKIKDVLDHHLESPMDDQEYQNFLGDFLQKANKQLARP